MVSMQRQLDNGTWNLLECVMEMFLVSLTMRLMASSHVSVLMDEQQKICVAVAGFLLLMCMCLAAKPLGAINKGLYWLCHYSSAVLVGAILYFTTAFLAGDSEFCLFRMLIIEAEVIFVVALILSIVALSVRILCVPGEEDDVEEDDVESSGKQLIKDIPLCNSQV